VTPSGKHLIISAASNGFDKTRQFQIIFKYKRKEAFQIIFKYNRKEASCILLLFLILPRVKYHDFLKNKFKFLDFATN